jgi:transcriptional regulator with XRE-family HTH domain
MLTVSVSGELKDVARLSRHFRRLSLKQTGALAGVKPWKVWQLEHGGDISPAELRKIAAALKVPALEAAVERLTQQSRRQAQAAP